MPALAAAGDPPPDGGDCRFGRNAAPAIRPPAARLLLFDLRLAPGDVVRRRAAAVLPRRLDLHVGETHQLQDEVIRRGLAWIVGDAYELGVAGHSRLRENIPDILRRL